MLCYPPFDPPPLQTGFLAACRGPEVASRAPGFEQHSPERERRVARVEDQAECGKAELWLSPFLRCSNSKFWRNSGEIPVRFR